MMLSYDVITISLNAGSTIGDTLRSVLAQDPPPRQYLIVDGGSTDDTVAQIQAARAAIPPSPAAPRLCLEAQAPRGPASAGIPAAWNQALRRATADLVFILNADDWYEPGAAATVVRAFAAAPAADLIASPIHYRQSPAAAVLRTQAPRSLLWLPVLMPIPHPGCFVRRRVYERIGLYDERYAISADYEFVYRAARSGCRLQALATPLVSMRPGGLARQRLALARRETLAIGRRYCRVPGLPLAAFLLRALLHR